MIQTENLVINGVQFTRTYSDSGRYVVRDGVEYDEAIDPTELWRTYVEGGLIPSEGEEAEELLDILLGGADD